MVNAITNYFRTALQELELVRWPTRQQAVRLSLITVVFTVVAAAVFGLVDVTFATVLKALLSATL